MASLKLSTEQARVRAITSGRHLILAPPGSGKTELLAVRLSDALKRGIKPESIACLTFTNRAARNMQLRAGSSVARVHIGNFHAYAISLLKTVSRFNSQCSVLDEEDRKIILESSLRSLVDTHSAPSAPTITAMDPWVSTLESHSTAVMRELGLTVAAGLPGQRQSSWSGRGEFWKWVEPRFQFYGTLRFAILHGFPAHVVLSARLALYKALSLTAHHERAGVTWTQSLQLAGLRLLHDAYGHLKAESMALDFDDLLNLTLDWLIANPNNPLSPAMEWVEVDETQDLNDIQWEILKRITTERACMVAFADPQQSIFSFIGARSETFDRNTIGFARSRMSVSFRSADALVALFRDYSNKVLGHSESLQADGSCEGVADPLLYMRCKDTTQELAILSGSLIPRLRKDDGTIAVLTRTNAETVGISATLSACGCSHFKVSQFDLFGLRIAKDFLAFMQVIATPVRRFPWVRVFHAWSGVDMSLSQCLTMVNSVFASGLLPHWLLTADANGHFSRAERLQSLCRSGRVVVFDTETTGLDIGVDDVIQFAAVELVDGIPGRAIDLYLKSDRDLSTTEKTHGISRSMLDQMGLDPVIGLTRALEFIGASPVCGHNVEFDLCMLEANVRRRLTKDFRKGRESFCTFELAVAEDPRISNHKLATLIAHYRLEGTNSHNAADDVQATVSLVRHLAGVLDPARAREFLLAHTRAIAGLWRSFAPVFHELRAYPARRMSFSDLFRMFLSLGSIYEDRHVAEVKEKLLRHMDHHCGSRPLHELLQNELPRYLLYSEPDLILDSDRVVVSTIHRAKGLEFDSVLLPNCHNESFPGYHARRDNAPESVAEDARVLYVAITRAKKRIVIMQPEKYENQYGQWPKGGVTSPSPFLKPLLHHFR